VKIKKIIFLFVLLGLFPFSCFKPKYPFAEIDNLIINLSKPYSNQFISLNDTIQLDTLFFKFDFEGRNIAYFQNHFDFNNSLFALTKPQNGYKGLKDKISDINIYSNKVFNGRIAGLTLNDIFYYQYGETTVNHLKNELNDRGIYFRDGHSDIYSLLLTQKPLDSLKHKFSVVMDFESGKKIVAYTSAIWK